MLHIIAQNFEQANSYARKRGVRPKDFRYISRPEYLYGLARGTKIIKTGTWSKHKLIFDILHVAEHRDFNITEEAI